LFRLIKFLKHNMLIEPRIAALFGIYCRARLSKVAG
jgi:hypothetical protein